MSIDLAGSQADFTLNIQGVALTEVVGFHAVEEISKPFFVDVSLASAFQITFDDTIGKEAVLTLRSQRGNRCLHGIVRKFSHTGKSGLKYLYAAQIVPFTQLLSLEQDCRIFQNKNVQDIVEDIFKDSNIPSDRYDFRLKNKDRKRRYCVQYRESDLDFITRILAEEGIYYCYEHSKDKHVMVMGDDPVIYKDIPGNKAITFKSESGLTPEKEVIFQVDFSHRVRPGTYTQTNYNFKHPSAPLETKGQSRDENIHKYEIYDYPGQYGEAEKGQKQTKVREEEQTALQDQIEGASNCPRLLPGHTFNLDGHDFKAFNADYLLIAVSHSGNQPQTLEEQATGGATYTNSFTAIPAKVSYRPPRDIEKPYIPGVQSATVVGPENEEIYVDEHGRVKVQFHWDRKGKRNEQSSCWLRCGQTWGGSGWGSVFIPRIGDEVLIKFMEGDPDWPVITGSVYNGANPPLYDLPANKTRSTIKTRSYPNSQGYNELRFEDKTSQEEIYLQGEKDWNILIKNDKGQTVGHDERLSVANNRDKTIAVNQSESIGVNKTIAVGVNHTENIEANMTRNTGRNKFDTTAINSMETIGLAKELTIGGLYQISVGGVMNETVIGAKTEEVGAVKALIVANNMTEYVMNDRKSTTDGDLTEKVAKTHHLQADEYILEATEKITLKAGASTIVMDKNSITITSPKKVAYPGPGTATSPAFNKDGTKKRYSQQVNLKDSLPADIMKGEGAPALRYVFKDNQGKIIGAGVLDDSLTTQRIYTQEEKGLNLYVFGGQWTTSLEVLHPTDEPSDIDADKSITSGKGEEA